MCCWVQHDDITKLGGKSFEHLYNSKCQLNIHTHYLFFSFNFISMIRFHSTMFSSRFLVCCVLRWYKSSQAWQYPKLSKECQFLQRSNVHSIAISETKLVFCPDFNLKQKWLKICYYWGLKSVGSSAFCCF